MEITIKMSLETARKLWKDNKVDGYIPLIDFLLENFTKEELEGKKGFTWEDSFGGKFFRINSFSGNIDVMASVFGKTDNSDRASFKTEAQAKSALAFAQLSHIVAKYNEGKLATTKDGQTVVWKIQGMSDGDLKASYFCPYSAILPIEHLVFIREEDAKLSLEVNRQLWLDYWMIGETVKATVIETSR